MKTYSSLRSTAIASALLIALLTGCGGDSPESLITSGKEFLAKNDGKAAIIQFKNALQKNPSLGEARYLLGKALLDGGDPQGAEIELRKALDLKFAPEAVVPLLAQAMLSLGQSKKLIDEFAATEFSGETAASLKTTLSLAYQTQGNAEAAQNMLAAALAAQPDFAPALIADARSKAARRDIPGALKIIDGVLEKSPGNHDALLLKGSLLAFGGDQAGALNYYNKAVQNRPDFIQAHSAIVTTLLQQGALDDAAKQVEALNKVAPSHPQTLYLKALLAYQRKDFKVAREALQQLLKIAPNNPIALQLAGAVEYQLGAFAQAESYLNKALQQAPELLPARSLLARNYLRMNDPAKAIDTLQPVLGKIDSNPALLALAGESYLQSGDPKRAEEYFAKASKLDPENPAKRTALAITHMAQGSVATATGELEEISREDKGVTADQALIASHLRRNELDKALKAIEVLQKKQPDNPATYNLQGRVLLAKKDNAAARKSFEKALAINPAYFPAAANLAAMDMAEKKPTDARSRFEAVLASDPKNVPALLSLARIAATTGGAPTDVLALINKAVAANPEAVAPRRALIDFHLANKEPKKASSAAQDALATIPDKPELLEAAARAQQGAGDVNQALATYSRLAALQPASPLPQMRMAEIQLANKNTDDAIKNLRRALEIKPDFLQAQVALIRVSLENKKSEEALSIVREIQKQRPKQAVGYLLEGDVHASDKRWPNALSAYRNGLKQASSTELAIRLHRALMASANAAEAEKFANSWAKDHPKDALFRLYQGDQATARKDNQAAAQYYHAALEIQPENPLILNNLAWVSGQLKSPKALEYAEKANKLSPNQPAFMDTQAMLLAGKGDTSGAIALLRKAIEIAPQAAGIRLNLAKVLISAGRKDEARSELDTLAKLGDKFPGQAEVGRLQKEL